MIEPFTQNEVSARFENAAPAIQTVLNADIHPDLLRRIPLQVERLRQDPLTDPLDLSVDVLFGASAAARARMPDAYSRACITGSDITTALASVFHTVDPQRLKAITAKIELLYSQLSSAVFGQEEMIERLIAIFGDHFKGLRPAHRPSAVLMTGATGVGKTEVIKAIAKFFGIPYMCLEGGDFTESHHVDMLTGSPPGYKDEGDGILTNFMSKHHEEAIVFIDEIDKAHLSFRRLIMNTLWTGGLRNKHGFDRHRPGYVYVAASNAGSDQITPDMELRKIHEVLAKAFSTKGGDTQPEFIARFELVHAHPIAEKPFRDAIEWILRDMESFPALQNFDVHVRNIDPAAVQHIFDQINNTCTYKQNSAGGIGFEQGRASNAQERKYFNLRQISFAMLHAIRESASSLVEQLTRDGASSLWAEGKVRNVDIVQSGGSIELRPIA